MEVIPRFSCNAKLGYSLNMLVLRPSEIAGVGVFTTTPIRKGVKPPLFVQRDWVFRKSVFGYKRHFGHYDKVRDGYWCPVDFNRMSIGWYLNHSETPNCTSAVHPRTLRFIRPGEELTIDYRLLER